MKINSIQNNRINYSPRVLKSNVQTKPQSLGGCNYVDLPYTELPLGNIYGTKISFSGYKGNENPVQDLYYVLTGNKKIKDIKVDPKDVFQSVNNPDKQWIAGVKPSKYLTMDAGEAIETLVKMNSKDGQTLKDIKTPNYGDNWGRHANYIEVNSRTLGKMEDHRCSEGIIGSIKMLNLIPPSSEKWANCVILSQIFPNIYGDGWNKPQNEENSLYTIKIEDKYPNEKDGKVEYTKYNDGLSENLTVNPMKRGRVEIKPSEQVKAFNDLAHLKGLKTGYRMLVSEDQMRIGYDEQFRWNNPEHVEKFIDMCVDGIDMGFDAIYFDSAKHVGGYDQEHYVGVGAVPSYDQMQYITSEIRKRTGRLDLSFVGEKCDDNIDHFKNMGLNAGTDYGNPNDMEGVKNISRRFKDCSEYAPGIEVSNDNDNGCISYEERLNRINNCLFGFDREEEKLPTLMQMHDIYPLNYGTNTHDLMLHNPSFANGEEHPAHLRNLFSEDETSMNYSKRANELFAYAIK